MKRKLYFLAVGLLAASAARADVYVEAHTLFELPDNTTVSWDSGDLAQTILNVPLMLKSMNFNGGMFTGTAYGTAEIGTLRGLVSASANGPAHGGTEAEFDFGDNILITSGGLFSFTNQLNVVPTIGNNRCNISAQSFVEGTNGFGSDLEYDPCPTSQFYNPNPNQSTTQMLNLAAGTNIEFQMGLVLFAGAGPSSASDFAQVDATHSAHLFIAALTPGAALTTSSGFDYAAAPEPSTAMLLFTGMFLVAASRGFDLFRRSGKS